MVFAWLEWESWILLTPEIQSSSIQWSNEDMCAYIYHINNTLKTCPLCDTGYTRCFRQPSKLWNLVLVIFAKVIWTNAIKKSQNVRKGRNRKKEFRGAKDFILVLEPGAQSPHQRLPLLPRPVELEQFDFTNFAEQSPFSHWFQLENKSTYFRGPPWSIEVLSWRVFHVICNNLTAV